MKTNDAKTVKLNKENRNESEEARMWKKHTQ